MGSKSSKAKEGELRQTLRSVTYILGDGTDTLRHSTWVASQDAGTLATWRTIALVTSEKSFDEIAAPKCTTRDLMASGASDHVPALVLPNATIIDIFPRTASADHDERQLWARKKLETTRKACSDNHGVVLSRYIKHLISQEERYLGGDFWPRVTVLSARLRRL